MAAGTGKPIDGTAHLRQSIADILSTPVGSRVMRREYGSQLADLVDQPFNGLTRMRLFGAVATALQRWEPRLRLRRVGLRRGETDGAFIIEVEGRRTDLPERSAPAAFDLNLTLGRASGAAGFSIA